MAKLNKFKELDLLTKTLKDVLCSDEFDMTLFYFNEFKKLLEYKEAYGILLSVWDCLEREQQKNLNKKLNKVFKLNKGEQLDKSEF